MGTHPKWTRQRPSSHGSSPTRSPARQLLTYHWVVPNEITPFG